MTMGPSLSEKLWLEFSEYALRKSVSDSSVVPVRAGVRAGVVGVGRLAATGLIAPVDEFETRRKRVR